MTTRRPIIGFILGLLLLGAAPTGATNRAGPTTIPSPVTTFVRGYASGDDDVMLVVASPLFRLELSRRGIVTSAERADIRPRGLTFTPRGGARDPAGFGHWFYTTRSVRPPGKAVLTLWRVDSDPHDFVIWIEPVYFFSGCDDVVSGDDRAVSRGRPDEVTATSSTIRLALHCPDTTEGYFVVQSHDAGQLSFFVVNAFGDTLPGAWSFGQSDERGDRSIASTLSLNAMFKGTGDQEYTTYYHSVGR
jgi:hypothetical protein